jgi:hypothetical protein
VRGLRGGPDVEDGEVEDAAVEAVAAAAAPEELAEAPAEVAVPATREEEGVRGEQGDSIPLGGRLQCSRPPRREGRRCSSEAASTTLPPLLDCLSMRAS